MADEQTQPPQQAPPEDSTISRDRGRRTETANGPSADGHAKANDHGKYAVAKPESNGQNQGSPDNGISDQKSRMSPTRMLVFGTIAAVVILFGLIWGIHYYHYSQTHVSTDDAYVTGNLINVSPIIGGTLSMLTVDEGSVVKQGQLIARLENSGQLAALRQAKAAYQAAQTQIPQAQINLAYQQQATQAAIQRAQAELAAQQAKTGGAQQQVRLAAATQTNQVRQAQSQIQQAAAQYYQALSQIKTAQAALRSQQQAVQTAQRAANAAAAQVQSARANQTRAELDRARYARLAQLQAVTQQQYDTALATAQTAEAQLTATEQQAAQAQSQVDQARENVAQAQSQVEAARRAAAASAEQINVARAGLGLVQANATNVGIQRSNVLNNVQQGGQAQADLAGAEAGRQQVALRRKEITTYEAQALQAQAAVANAQVTYNDTIIYAPSSGTVVKKAVNVGTALAPGQTVVTMTQGDYVYVTGNFKETQLRDVRPGEYAEVEVDSFPGRIFHGYVQSVISATGASTALLPPDNATGNFTKVVQRIPVRIELYPADDNEDKQYARAADLRNLRQGMSVTATIDTSSDSAKMVPASARNVWKGPGMQP